MQFLCVRLGSNYFRLSYRWFAKTYSEYFSVENNLRQGKYPVVEGEIKNFIPMPFQGHGEESFDVENSHFSYSDYEMTPGFHNAASHGGPIHEGLRVRISYVGNTILKLEIAQWLLT